MARYNKTPGGRYSIKGAKYEQLVGTRAQVWHGTAYKTSGGLVKSDLMQNKAGRIVSKDKHFTAKKEKRLIKAGYFTKKGKFGFVKKSSSRKMRGGLAALSPMPYDGQGVGTSGVNLQIVAGMHGGRRHRSRRNKSRRYRGGAPYGNSLVPEEVSGMRGTTLQGDSNSVQFRAGNAN